MFGANNNRFRRKRTTFCAKINNFCFERTALATRSITSDPKVAVLYTKLTFLESKVLHLEPKAKSIIFGIKITTIEIKTTTFDIKNITFDFKSKSLI